MPWARCGCEGPLVLVGPPAGRMRRGETDAVADRRPRARRSRSSGALAGRASATPLGPSAEVAQDLLDLARAAGPGGDKQLQLVRAVAAHAVTDVQTGAVAAWLDGSEALEGLAVDQDLRWDLLVGLVAAGRADEAAIAAEEARDRTTTGRERAAQARAAVPTPQAKAAVWRELMEDVSMPNETQVKTLRDRKSNV